MVDRPSRNLLSRLSRNMQSDKDKIISFGIVLNVNCRSKHRMMKKSESLEGKLKELSISPQWKEFFFLLLQDPLCSISILTSEFETICFEPLYSTLKVGFYSIISSIYQVTLTAFPITGKRIWRTVSRGILKIFWFGSSDQVFWSNYTWQQGTRNLIAHENWEISKLK